MEKQKIENKLLYNKYNSFLGIRIKNKYDLINFKNNLKYN